MKKAIVLFLLLGIFALPVRSYASPAGFGIFAGHFVFHHGHHFAMAGGKATFLTSMGPMVIFAPVAAAAIWHIPAWTEAKAHGTEAAYQAQKMWPQEQIARFGARVTIHVSDFENSLL